MFFKKIFPFKSAGSYQLDKPDVTVLENYKKYLNPDRPPNGHTNSGTNGSAATAGAEPTENFREEMTWSNSLEFLMSCIAMNVGLGNIWRFPFVAYENGGGAFLIPYLLVLLLLGKPMYYLEMCLGQFSSRANVKMFENLAPALKGLGYGQLVGTICVATYYCSLMAVALFYFVNSFTFPLPWAECYPEIYKEYNCIPSASIPDTPALNSMKGNDTISSSELWFRIKVLKETDHIESGIGYPDWQLTICLTVSWLITFLVSCKGVQSSGKASYFLAIFPFFILGTLLIRAVTLKGASTGILYFIKPQWHKLLTAKVWYNAVTQCFFSLNIGFGSVVMYASYNSFNHNVYRDAMIVTTLDTCTSCLAGLIIFGILGNLATKMGVEVDRVVKSGGTGLAFISYPEAIAKFNAVPYVFAILFFLMLFVLGVGSLVALQGCFFTVIKDSFHQLKTWHVSLFTAIVGFLVGLFYVTPGGQYIFTMVDFFGGTFIFYVLTIVEVISIMWWYGLENVCLDIEFMVKHRPGIYWRICWALIIPVVLLVVFIYFLFTLEPLTYENKTFPNYIIVWGWILLGFGILQPVFWFIIEYLRRYRQGAGLYEAFINMFKHDQWGPKDEKMMHQWRIFKRTKKQIRLIKNRSYILDRLLILIGR